MFKKIAIASMIFASLPVLYVLSPLFLPRRLSVSIHWYEPRRSLELARIDRLAAQEKATYAKHP